MARGKQARARDLKNPFRRRSVLSLAQLRHYRIIKRIGRGSFGAVYQAEKKGVVVALKLVNMREVPRDQFVVECEMAKVFSELNSGPVFVKSWRIPKEQVGVIVTELWDTNLSKHMDVSGSKCVHGR
jgi:serine/threonine protein kinase